jgi:hypothetical protein
MATMQSKGHVFGLYTGDIKFLASDGSTAFTGYVQFDKNNQSLELKHNGTVDRIVGQTGEITSLIAHGEHLEVTLDFIPEGATLAAAKAGAAIPPGVYGAKITGLPIIIMGSFSDALNTDGGSTQPWFYEFDGTISGAAEGKWTGKITLHRYPSITSAAVIT